MEGKDLTQGKLINNMLKLLIPLILINLLNSIYNIVDAIWIGNLVGEDGVSAITNCFPLTLVVTAISTAVSLATSVLVSQYYGAKDSNKVKLTIGNSYVFSIIIGITTAIFMIVTLPIWFKVLNTPIEILGITKTYAIIYMIGFVFNCFLLVIMEGLKATGNSKIPLIFVAIGTLINIVLDPILIKMGLGISGAAYATLIAMFISALIGIIYVNKKSNLLKFDKQYLKLNKICLKELLKIGLPIVAEQWFGTAVIMVEVYITNMSGVIGSAAYGVVSKLEQIIIVIGMSFKSLLTITVGQFIGNGKTNETTKILKEGFKLEIIPLLCISFIIFIIPWQFCRIFVNSEEVILMAVKFLFAVGTAFVLWPIRQLVNGFIVGTGHTSIISITAIIASVIEVTLIYILIQNGLENLIALGFGILAYALVELSINTIYLLTNKWRKEVL